MRRFAIIALLLAVPAITLLAQSKPAKPRPRAALPKEFPNAEGVFFNDVFKEGIVGPRPDLGKAVVGGNTGTPTTPDPGSGTETGGGAGWSKIISSTTLEDEIKAGKKVLDEEVSTPAKFAGNGYKVARKQFSVLAIMFAIIGEYDGDVRWKVDGPGARDVFGRTASNCKVGTIQVFNEAKLRKTDLEDLLSGSGLKKSEAEKKPTWKTVTDRAPSMQRLELAHQGRMQPWVANKAEFADHAEEMLHEAQLAAAFGEVLMKEGMEDGDDTDYQAFCKKLQTAALDIVSAVKTNDYEKARKAVGQIDQSCAECHQSYRS